MKKVKANFFIGFLVIVSCVAKTDVIAQQQNSPAKYVASEDSAAMNALVLYPANIRIDIFEACVYPSAIVKIASLQKKISADFSKLISGYSKEKQEIFWNLSRYPDLVRELVKRGKKSEEEIKSIVSHYPSDIHDAAIKYGQKHYDVLKRMEELQTQTNTKFSQILADYPQVTQDALNALIQYPEIISLLNEHLELTVRVGDHYRRDPQEVMREASEKNIEEEKQNEEDAEAWKENMEQNPDEASDLKNASSDYATENGYTSDEIYTEPDPDYINNYTCNPYSYWFGYPTWYPYSYWYPYPFWFDCGFYYGPSGQMIFIGHPSYYFTNWYFYYPNHMQRYPNLCNTYVDHYYGPRRHIGGSDIIVHNWVNENKDYLPKDFTTNKSGRVETIRQVGQLNMDAQKGQGKNTISSVERDEYYQQNSAQYPLLNANQPVREKENKPTINTITPPVNQPPVRITKQSKQPDNNPIEYEYTKPENRQETSPPATNFNNVNKAGEYQQPVNAPAQNTWQENRQEESPPPATNFNNINRAQEYHRNVWENTQPVSRPQAPPPSFSQPIQRSQPAPRQPSNSFSPRPRER